MVTLCICLPCVFLLGPATQEPLPQRGFHIKYWPQWPFEGDMFCLLFVPCSAAPNFPPPLIPVVSEQPGPTPQLALAISPLSVSSGTRAFG